MSIVRQVGDLAQPALEIYGEATKPDAEKILPPVAAAMGDIVLGGTDILVIYSELVEKRDRALEGYDPDASRLHRWLASRNVRPHEEALRHLENQARLSGFYIPPGRHALK